MANGVNQGMDPRMGGGYAEGMYANRLLVKSGGRVAFVRVQEIDWIEAQGNYLRLHRGTGSYLVRQTMNDMETFLDPRRFIRIHRSTIVSVDRIKEIRPMPRGDFEIALLDGVRLTLSRKYRDKVPTSLRSLL
jgi:two-component system LytT family response regulator